MSEILSAKVWWQRVNNSTKPWVKLWSIKYARDRPRHLLIPFNEAPSASTIWLKSMVGKMIIEEHSLWEIRNGRRMKFSEYSWNQFSILGRDPRWALIKQQEHERGKILLNQSWRLGNHMDHHQWKFPEKPEHTSEENWEVFHEELNKCFIKAQEGPNILIWGYSSRGSFSVNEAYRISRNVVMDDIWKKNWTVNLWPKVALFAWLVARGRIITSENL